MSQCFQPDNMGATPADIQYIISLNSHMRGSCMSWFVCTLNKRETPH